MLDTESIAADQVVLAVPPPAAEALLPGGGTHAPAGWAERLGASPIVNVHVRYDRPVTEHAFFAAVGSPVQWVFDRTAAQRRRRAGSTWPSRCPRPAGEMDERAADVVAEIVPGAGRAAAGGPGRHGAGLLRDPGAHRDVPAGTGQRRPAPAGRLGGARVAWPVRGPPPAGRRRWRARCAAGHAAADVLLGRSRRSDGGGSSDRRGRAW